MNMTEEIYRELAKQALEARKKSYSPYSHFQVGAALYTEDGRIFTGCNIENAAYTPTICAERTTIFKAVSEGGAMRHTAIAIAGGPEKALLPLQECPPCGVCRQVMMEFCDPDDFEIILVRGAEEYSIYKLKDLLPMGFGPSSL